MIINKVKVNNLYQLKKAHSLTFIEIGSKLGISKQAAFEMLGKPPETFNYKHKLRLADALGTTIDIVDRVVKMQIESEGTNGR